MKKSFLSLLLATGAITTFVAFHACSSDENNDPQPITRTQLLLKKSKEFAQKYNVDLEVDEAQLEKVADTLSVEQMEKDYQVWAKLTNTPIIIAPQRTKSTNGLRLTKRRASFESTSISGHDTGFAENNSDIAYEIFYNIGNNGNGNVRVIITYDPFEGMTILQPIGVSFYNTNRCSFTAVGSVKLTSALYKTITRRVWVEHSYTGKTICRITKQGEL